MLKFTPNYILMWSDVNLQKAEFYVSTNCERKTDATNVTRDDFQRRPTKQMKLHEISLDCQPIATRNALCNINVN
jgi:hypothetical protein